MIHIVIPYYNTRSNVFCQHNILYFFSLEYSYIRSSFMLIFTPYILSSSLYLLLKYFDNFRKRKKYVGPNNFDSIHVRSPSAGSGGSDCLQEDDKTSAQAHPESRLEERCCLSLSVSFGSQGYNLGYTQCS